MIEAPMKRLSLFLILLIIFLTPSIILGDDGKCVQGDCVNGLGIFLNKGARYIGKWKDGRHNGDGIINYPNGDKYIGEWKDGKRHGEGTLNFSDGGKYVGEWKNDLPDGRGTELNPDGRRYIGEWKDGNPDGRGTELNPDGTKYGGEWKDGKRHGEGTLNYPDGSKYIGEWKNDLPDGQGIDINPDGRRYIGEWKDGKKNGQGILNYPDGSKYIGEWKDDLPDGQGTELNPDGTKYEGQFKNGVKSGPKREISIDVIRKGGRREGEIVNFTPEPDKLKELERYDSAEKCIEKGHCKRIKGFAYYTNGSSYEGEFLHMLPHGSGFYILPDGTPVSSQENINLPHGKGKFISGDGEIIEGNFILGKHVAVDVTKSQQVEVKKVKTEVASPVEKNDEPEPKVIIPAVDVTKSQLAEAVTTKTEAAAPVEKKDEPEPKVILPQNLETTKAVEYARISVGANIRSDASLKSEVLHTVPPGFPVAVLERQSDWLLVEDYQGRKGWVFASLVKEPKTVIIKVVQANLRSGPKINDDIIVQLNHEKIMPVLERRGEWLKVTDFEGLTGWLHRKVIWPEVEMNAQ